MRLLRLIGSLLYLVRQVADSLLCLRGVGREIDGALRPVYGLLYLVAQLVEGNGRFGYVRLDLYAVDFVHQ